MLVKPMPISELRPADYNPRKDLQPGDAEYEKLKRSLTEFGYVEPVIWNKTTGNVVGGHQRLKVLADLGHTDVDCVVVELDETREKALNVALNKISGEWDENKLALLIADLDAADFDAELTGFDDDEIAQMIGSLDDDEVTDDGFDLAAALEAASFVQRGDIWTVGRHRLVCGDATNPGDVTVLMDGKSANLVLTDPPYNVAFESSDGLTIKNDAMKADSFYEFLLTAFTNMAGVLDKGGSAYVFHADTEGLNFRKAFIDAGFKLSGCCIWVKDSLVLGRSPYQWQHEPVLYGWKQGAKHKWFADRKQTTIWNFAKPRKNSDHPTSKPLDLLAYPIRNSTQTGAIILDIFAGSGSTLMAAEQTDRIAYCMELDEKYASVILRRYADATGDAAGITCQRDGTQYTYLELVKQVDRDCE
ncbi:site-specific DNA-methyltransferase [Corynebacterium silvaticum]|uniref:Site-specific DNA-methyltransferase n=1 Tax=Corynebacterium silvaticum TaxID=2320431 RepID=A0A7Y4LHT3_9CORY|nr:site-specific DNA-methyltransferase [Corynebacterium silvaticum]ARU45723.1 site-specific DNA-methyltransferase [Corynebacterium silvaticum]NON70311.1 DNA modification methylase [Corynebacterium silvaticum]UWH00838.1 DNA modification methylase [Corynebacterium silvaticum]UWH02886.1 DNA modification methylase [Corynebacterium silvaticum]UWH04925.1 DNA modification methylase [Corynebacterium silvaticum]